MTNTKQYKNASLIFCGTMCTILLVNSMTGIMCAMDGTHVIPGFWAMASLCYPLLYCWLGVLLRAWKPDPKWWIQLLVAGMSMFCIYRYLCLDEGKRFIVFLYLAMTGIGYLVPPRTLKNSSRNNGWISLIMVAISAFCYTAIAVALQRLLKGPFMPEHEDMQEMLATIFMIAEPLMAIIVAYFVVQFSFSRIAQDLGSRSWFIGMVAVPCIYTFIVSVLRLLPPRWTFCVDSMFYSPVLWLIVQPVTVYLAISLFRWLVILKKRSGTRPRYIL